MDTPRCRKDISIPLQDILCPNVLATTEHKFLWYRCISTLICKDMTTVLYNWLSGSCLARALLEGEYFVFGESLRAQSRRFANIWLQSFGPKVASPTKNVGGLISRQAPWHSLGTTLQEVGLLTAGMGRVGFESLSPLVFAFQSKGASWALVMLFCPISKGLMLRLISWRLARCQNHHLQEGEGSINIANTWWQDISLEWNILYLSIFHMRCTKRQYRKSK